MTSHHPQRPNIVTIVSDDQGHWALGCAGNREVHTPYLDALAASGIRFQNFFCASPVCSAARASILTGRIPSQHGVHDWIRGGNFDVGAVPSFKDVRNPPIIAYPIEYLAGQTAYTDVLAASGYLCGLSGKWHLGDSAKPQKSFAHWFAHTMGGWSYYDAFMVRNGEIYREPRYVTDAITDDALAFLDNHAGNHEPFYLHVCYTAPHDPWTRKHHPEEYLKLYDDCPFVSTPDEPLHPWHSGNNGPRGVGDQQREECLRGYYAAITAMDAGIGRIMARLETLGLRENTLVLFTSDNGMNMGHHGIWGKGNGTFPPNMFDTSVKVPAMVSWPGQVPQGALNADLLSHYDLMPTLLDYLGLEHPGADKLPGRSFAPLLRGQQVPARERVVVCDEYGPVRMLRTREWKYVHRYPFGPNELYDLTNDLDERVNLIDDASQKEVVIALKADLESWFIRYVNPEIDGAKEAVWGRGQIEKAGLWGKGSKAFADDWIPASEGRTK